MMCLRVRPLSCFPITEMLLQSLFKEFRKAKRLLDKPLLKGAYVQESVYLGDEMLDALVASNQEKNLIGDIMLLQSPAKNVISALQSGGNKIHGVLETLSKKSNRTNCKTKLNNPIKMADLKKFAEELVNLTVKEVNELAKSSRKSMALSLLLQLLLLPDPQPVEQKTCSAEEKTSFDVILKAAGGQKLQIVNSLRSLTGLG
jgi:hypothetical protein